MASILHLEHARAGVGLQKLLGPITDREGDGPGSKRKRHRAELAIVADRMSWAVVECKDMSTSMPCEQVSIPFASPPPWAAVADQIKVLHEKGMTAYAISNELHCIYSWIAKGLEWWHQQRGLPMPTYQEKRGKLDKLSQAEAIADEVIQMIDEKVPFHEIANRLRCHRDTVTAAKKIGYERRGLPVPDGRLLRRLRNPNSRCNVS